MVSVKVASIAGALALFATVANAADMPSLPPVYIPPVEEYAAGWYLRGDIGMTNQGVKNMFNSDYNRVTSVDNVQKDFDSAMLFGLGVGYQWNHWLRTDVIGQYRGKANFHGFDITHSVGVPGSDEYRASKSEWLFLANVYADLGTWWCVTPFVGAGIGVSRNTISSFMDMNTPNGGVAYGDTVSKWNFAWALHTGISYKVNSQLSLEFGYSYVSLGNAASGDLKTFDGTNARVNPMEFQGLYSHDLKFGVRWLLEAPQPSYQMQPPLMRRG
jgi:opacity protein-like surface antigen